MNQNQQTPDGEQNLDSPIFDAMADRAPIELEAAEPGARPDPGPVPPDAAARDAARRRDLGPVDDALHDREFHFVTRGLGAEERAAVIAVLTRVRADETERVRRVERRELRPWTRSQRVPEGIAELLVEG